MSIHAVKNRHQDRIQRSTWHRFTTFSYTCLRPISRGFGVIVSSEAPTGNAYGVTRRFHPGVYCSMAFGEAQEQVSGHRNVCDATGKESNGSTPSRRLTRCDGVE